MAMRLSHTLTVLGLAAAGCSSPVDPPGSLATPEDQSVMTAQTTLRGFVVLGPIGSEAEVSLSVEGTQIQLSGLTESLGRLPGREVEVHGRFLSDVRFFVERISLDPNQPRNDDHGGNPPPPPPDW
jgi:hypothetical protein